MQSWTTTLKHWAIGTSVLSLFVIVVVLTFIPIVLGVTSPTLRVVAAVVAPEDEMTLSEGLQRASEFVDRTASVTAPDLPVSPASSNPNIAVADELQNNYSLRDRSHPHQGYGDCDGLRHLIDDGWRATYRVKISLRYEEDAERLLVDTKRYWESQGFAPRFVAAEKGEPTYSSVATSADAEGLVMDAGYATYRLSVDRMQRRATIWGITSCLPPN